MENEIQSDTPLLQPTSQTTPPITSPIKSTKIILPILLGLIIIATSIYLGIQIGKNQTTNQQPITEQPINNPTQTVVTPTALPTISDSTNTTQGTKFTGIITETNNGCWADGICSIKVDNKWIVAEIGGLRPPNSKPEIRGNLIGINFTQDTNKYIGKRAEVYAKQTDSNNFTIYSNENYYIKLLE